MERPIKTVKDHPLSRLYIAINHFIATGDSIGDGMTISKGPQRHSTGDPHPEDLVRILVPVNTMLAEDRKNFEKFKARFKQIEAEFSTKIDYNGQEHGFMNNSFVIQFQQADPLAQRLTEEPGPLGWGTTKELIDEHYPG